MFKEAVIIYIKKWWGREGCHKAENYLIAQKTKTKNKLRKSVSKYFLSKKLFPEKKTGLQCKKNCQVFFVVADEFQKSLKFEVHGFPLVSLA